MNFTRDFFAWGASGENVSNENSRERLIFFTFFCNETKYCIDQSMKQFEQSPHVTVISIRVQAWSLFYHPKSSQTSTHG
jgi:hypothetical protein